ncbi:AMP-binding protein [Burkholderia pseudomallei]|uniref:AMP-binding protein n=1 Tax=Burkholderia pseudomallei TaxID=28450 RepID=UPI0035E3C923
MIYTSGSTGAAEGGDGRARKRGESDGVRWTRRSHRTHPSARRVSLNASIAFDSLRSSSGSQLLSGRTLVVVPEPVRFDGCRGVCSMRSGETGSTSSICTPSQLALIEGARGPEDEAFPQVTLVGGEAIGRRDVVGVGEQASSRTYYNVYGPTECTVDAYARADHGERACAAHRAAAGERTRAYVLNERLSPAPVGVRGGARTSAGRVGGTRVFEPAGADAGAVHRRSVRGGWAAV